MMQESEPPKLGGGEDGQVDQDTTDSLDLTCMFGRNFTATGSFDLRGVQAKSLSKLLDSLPMPGLLVDDVYAVAYANDFWNDTIGGFDKIEGRAFNLLFPDQNQAAEVHNLLRRTFADRKPRARKLALNTGKSHIWGRMHLRSVRLGWRRYILVLYQDLTVEKEQLNLIKKHSEELRIAHDQLEKRVEARTADLKQTNALLLLEIAERKRTEEALRESEANYRAIFDAANDAILVQDVDTLQILDANSKVYEIFGYTPDELRNLTLHDLSADDQMYSEKDPLAWSRKAAEGTPQLFELFCKNKAGRSFWVEVNLKGAVIGGNDRLLAVVRDITERKQLEEQLLESRKMEALGTLAGGVAHNFNNLLQVVMGGISLALIDLEIGNPAQVKQSLDQVLESTRFGAETVNRLQSFAQIRADSPPGDADVFDLSEVAKETAELTKPLWKSVPEKEGIKLDLILDLQDRCLVRGKANELFEVLLNLVKNAAQAMPKGGKIQIKTSIDGNEVVLKVSDTGVGIKRENLNRIFEPFWSTNDMAVGRGLGLAVSHGIIGRHGGTIGVESEEGLGSTLTVRLPLAPKAGEIVRPSGTEFLLRNLSVLVIDDIALIVRSITGILAKHGQTVFSAMSGEEGMEIFRNNKIDLVICDLGMPGMNGYDVGKAVRAICQERGIPKTPFILLTGWDVKAQEQDKIIESGVDAILKKPLDAKNLLADISKVVERVAP